MRVPLPIMRLSLAAAALLATQTVVAQELPPDPGPPPMVGPETPPPSDAPPPSAPPPRANEPTAQSPGLQAEVAQAAKEKPEESLPVFLRHLGALGAAWGPAPSPDGLRLGFVTTLFGSRQAALVPVNGGYPVQLTDEPGGVLSLRWAPIDPHLIFATVVRAGERRVLALDDAGGAPREIDASPGEQLLGGFSRDGKRLLFATVAEAGVKLQWLQLDGNKLTEVAPPLPQQGAPATPPGQPAQPPPAPLAESLKGLFAISPPTLDGKYVAALTRSGADEQLLLVELATTRVEPLAQHQGPARFRLPRFTPDGRQLYVLTDAGRPALGVDVIQVQSKQRKAVFAPLAEVESYALSEDGHKLVAAQVSGGETLFTELEMPSLRTQPLPQPPPGALASAAPGELAIQWSRAGDRVYFAWGQADDTTDVYVLRTDFGSAQRLTRSPRPGLPEGALTRPRSTAYTSFDGRQIPALLWPQKPLRKADQSAPPLGSAVLLNGGQARPVLDARIAALSAVGLQVLAPSLRGSEGRGKEHAQADAEGALKDVASAAAFLRNSSNGEARPLLVGLGPGARTALDAAARDPGSFSGLVLISDEPVPRDVKVNLPVIALPLYGTQALHELVAFAREQAGKAQSAQR